MKAHTHYQVAIGLLLTALLIITFAYYGQRQRLQQDGRDIEGLARQLGEAHKTLSEMATEQAREYQRQHPPVSQPPLSWRR